MDGSTEGAGSLLAFSAEDTELVGSEEADALGAGASLLDAAGASDEDDGAAFGLADAGAGAGAEELAAEEGSVELELTALELAELVDEVVVDAAELEDEAEDVGSAEAADDTAEDAGSLEAADDMALDEAGALDALDDADDDGSSLGELEAEEAWSPLPSCVAAWSSPTASYRLVLLRRRDLRREHRDGVAAGVGSRLAWDH